MIDGLADGNGRTPVAVVREYLELRREWELSTMERVTGWERGDPIDPERDPDFDADAFEEAKETLAQLRLRWCTPEALTRVDPRPSFGTGPMFNPDGLEILSVDQVSDDEVRLRTREYPFGLDIASDWEYTLRLMGDEWRLDARSSEGLQDLL